EKNELKIMKMKMRMMKLEDKKLKHQKRLTEKDISFQLTLNKSSTFVYQQDKMNIFHKYVVFRVLKLAFKLEDQSNYNNWQNEALTQTHFIEVKMILKNRQRSSFMNLFNNDLEV